jgi:hypothetical protein
MLPQEKDKIILILGLSAGGVTATLFLSLIFTVILKAVSSRYLPEVGQIKEKIFRRIKKAFLDVIERPEDYVAYLDYNPTHTRSMVEHDEDAFYSPIRKKGYITELSMRGKILKELFYAGYQFTGGNHGLPNE